MKSSISFPIFLWSRFLASSSMTRYSSSIFFFGKEMPYSRCICSRVASPRQKAPATLVSLTAFIAPVFNRWGPLQRSVKEPWVYVVMVPSSKSWSICSHLYVCPASPKSLSASFLLISFLTTGSFLPASSFILASIFGKSDSFIDSPSFNRTS